MKTRVQLISDHRYGRSPLDIVPSGSLGWSNIKKASHCISYMVKFDNGVCCLVPMLRMKVLEGQTEAARITRLCEGIKHTVRDAVHSGVPKSEVQRIVQSALSDVVDAG